MNVIERQLLLLLFTFSVLFAAASIDARCGWGCGWWWWWLWLHNWTTESIHRCHVYNSIIIIILYIQKMFNKLKVHNLFRHSPPRSQPIARLMIDDLYTYMYVQCCISGHYGVSQSMEEKMVIRLWPWLDCPHAFTELYWMQHNSMLYWRSSDWYIRVSHPGLWVSQQRSFGREGHWMW